MNPHIPCQPPGLLSGQTLLVVEDKIKAWVSHLVQHLLNSTHRQWLNKNARIHLRKAEGLTTSEHMMLVDPSDLLPWHKQLLEQDYNYK